jgi:hypothetical protein
MQTHSLKATAVKLETLSHQALVEDMESATILWPLLGLAEVWIK